MVLYDVCLEMVFCDLPYEERIRRIAESGFDRMEFWFHDATFDGETCSRNQPKDADALRQVCEACGVTINNMVLNAPDGSFGGAPVNSGDLSQYLDRLHEVIDFGKRAGCSSAITCSGNWQADLSREQMRANLEHALAQAASIAEKAGFSLLLEPLNTHVDHAGYYLDSSAEAAEIVRRLGSPNLKLLYDIYHMQIMEGNLIATIGTHLDIIGHFHAAGVPGRAELDRGEINYPQILQYLAQSGYCGSFGLEYAPALRDHAQSLRAMRSLLNPNAA